MPVSGLHRQVATIALDAAAGHGFALGGGNALLAHGIITRPTRDVDLFSNRQGGVEAAAASVEAALLAAGLVAERRDQAGGLADIFPGMGEGLAEWIVTAPGGEQMLLQLAYFDRGREPVVMDLGPVLDIEDVAGGKVCVLAGRVEPRDYADSGPAGDLQPGPADRFARRLDPGLTDRDFADAGPAAGPDARRDIQLRSGSAGTMSPPCASSSPRGPDSRHSVMRTGTRGRWGNSNPMPWPGILTGQAPTWRPGNDRRGATSFAPCGAAVRVTAKWLKVQCSGSRKSS